MTDRTTETYITFNHPFQLSALVMPLAAGTYRVITDEDTIPGLSFTVYRRVSTMLQMPAMGNATGPEQYLGVDPRELEAARLKDAAASRA